MKRKIAVIISAFMITVLFAACAPNAAVPQDTQSPESPPEQIVQQPPPETNAPAETETPPEPETPPEESAPAGTSPALPPAASYTPTPSDLRDPSEMTLMPPVSLGEFKASTELPEGAIQISLTDRTDIGAYQSSVVEVLRDVVYDNRDGEELVLQILLPTGVTDGPYPLIMYIPGSAWMRQNVYMSIPQMTRVAERGFAVAIVEYRGTDVAFFPATVEDTKTAIRFMRKNAAEYNINPDMIAAWGDSSGGHTAAFIGVTNDGELDNGTYNEFSARVNCIVDWYGPSDLLAMGYYHSMLDHSSESSPEGMLIGGVNVQENPELAKKASPVYYVAAETDVPPTLIMHGSNDFIMPFNQSVRFYEKLREHGKDVIMYKVEGGGHGMGGFAGDGALDIVTEFISQQLGL